MYFIKEIIIILYKQYINIIYNLKNFLNYISNIYINDNFINRSWDLITYNNIYWLFFFIIIFSSLGVIFSKNPIHSVFFLILVFLHVGFFLLLLNVEFLAFLLFIVYLGAIAVLFLFVIMMFNIHILEARDNIIRYIPLVILIFLIIWEMSYINIIDLIKWKKEIYSINIINYEHKNWYSLLFSKDNMILLTILYNYYFYQFIIASLILLIAMLGAIILTLNQSLNLKKQIYYKQNMKNVYNSLTLKTKNTIKPEIWKIYLKRKKDKNTW